MVNQVVSPPWQATGAHHQQRVFDAQRFRRLADAHVSFVWRCLRRLGVPAADADDSAQEVLLVLASRLHEVPPDKERAFLFATAARIAANARRAARRRQSAYEGLQHAPPTSADESQDVLSDQLRARELLDALLEQLPDDLREVFVMFEVEEMSIAEVMDALKISQGTVGSRLRRAREAFAQVVKRHRARSTFDARQGNDSR
jgi:RNA polymerase sigma-70 factor (ECF subfamily)